MVRTGQNLMAWGRASHKSLGAPEVGPCAEMLSLLPVTPETAFAAASQFAKL